MVPLNPLHVGLAGMPWGQNFILLAINQLEHFIAIRMIDIRDIGGVTSRVTND